jgi:ornithine--oxo-acid transaminase
VARTALKVLVEEKMVENSAEMGAYFLEGLRRIDSHLIKEVRGRGLMIGLELKPQAGGARHYCERLKQVGILCKDTHNNIIRISPPLVIQRDEIDWALERFEAVLTKNSNQI